jgi:hypothetical protein
MNSALEGSVSETCILVGRHAGGLLCRFAKVAEGHASHGNSGDARVRKPWQTRKFQDKIAHPRGEVRRASDCTFARAQLSQQQCLRGHLFLQRGTRVVSTFESVYVEMLR